MVIIFVRFHFLGGGSVHMMAEIYDATNAKLRVQNEKVLLSLLKCRGYCPCMDIISMTYYHFEIIFRTAF